MALADGRKGPSSVFSLKHRFTGEWLRFVGAGPAGADHIQTFALGIELFPFYQRSKKIRIPQIQLLALTSGAPLPPFDVFVTPSGAIFDPLKDKISLVPNPVYGGTLHGVKAYAAGQEKAPGTWTVRITAADFAAVGSDLKDLQIALVYSAT
jgi:hypothetical protein